MTIKFSNPISGRKKPLHLNSLFLFHPDVILKLSGLSISGMMKESGLESIHKRMTNIGDEEAAKRLANDMLNRMPSLPESIVAAIQGNTEAQAYHETIGAWEAIMMGYSPSEDQWPEQIKFLIAIERSTDQSWKLFHEQQYDEAVSLLLNSPLVHLLLWPEAIDILKKGTSLQSILPLRGLIALEVLLSFLSALDAITCHSLSKSDSLALDVLPTTHTGNKNPTALFFRWIKKQTGLDSISVMLDAYKPDTQNKSETLDESLLKRWSNGSHMPSEEALRRFLESFFPDPNAKEIWMRHYATKCLTFIGYQAQQLQKITTTDATTNLLKEAHRPLPDMPFGFKTIESWFENRYPYWFDYHYKQINGEGIKPSPGN